MQSHRYRDTSENMILKLTAESEEDLRILYLVESLMNACNELPKKSKERADFPEDKLRGKTREIEEKCNIIVKANATITHRQNTLFKLYNNWLYKLLRKVRLLP